MQDSARRVSDRYRKQWWLEPSLEQSSVVSRHRSMVLLIPTVYPWLRSRCVHRRGVSAHGRAIQWIFTLSRGFRQPITVKRTFVQRILLAVNGKHTSFSLKYVGSWFSRRERYFDRWETI